MLEGVLIGLALWWVGAFVVSFVYYSLRDPLKGNNFGLEEKDG